MDREPCSFHQYVMDRETRILWIVSFFFFLHISFSFSFVLFLFNLLYIFILSITLLFYGSTQGPKPRTSYTTSSWDGTCNIHRNRIRHPGSGKTFKIKKPPRKTTPWHNRMAEHTVERKEEKNNGTQHTEKQVKTREVNRPLVEKVPHQQGNMSLIPVRMWTN